MTKSDISTTLVKLFGLWLVVEHIIGLASHMPQLHGEFVVSNRLQIIEILAWRYLFPMGIGLLLFAIGGHISRFFFPSSPPLSDWDTFEARLLATIGAGVFAWSLIVLLSGAALVIETLRQYDEMRGTFGTPLFQASELALLAQSVVGLALGLYMILGSHGLVRLWRRLRGKEAL